MRASKMPAGWRRFIATGAEPLRRTETRSAVGRHARMTTPLALDVRTEHAERIVVARLGKRLRASRSRLVTIAPAKPRGAQRFVGRSPGPSIEVTRARW